MNHTRKVEEKVDINDLQTMNDREYMDYLKGHEKNMEDRATVKDSGDMDNMEFSDYTSH